MYAVQPARLPNMVDGEYKYFADASHIADLPPAPLRPSQTLEYRLSGTAQASPRFSLMHQFLHPTAKCLSDKLDYRSGRCPTHLFRCQNGWYRQLHRQPRVVEMPGKPVLHKDEYDHQSYGCPTAPQSHTGHGQ